jgi:Winged helix-turn helix
MSIIQDNVWRLLRQMGWSSQRPTGRALERNEAEIAEWKKEMADEKRKSSRPSTCCAQRPMPEEDGRSKGYQGEALG